VRVLVALAVLVAAVAAISVLSTNRAAIVVAAVGLVIGFGVLGQLDTAEGRPVFLARAPERRLTQERLTDAFIAAKLASPDRPISLVKPVSRDGVGWSATLDLPSGMASPSVGTSEGGRYLCICPGRGC
jgi:hypothetical protein